MRDELARLDPQLSLSPADNAAAAIRDAEERPPRNPTVGTANPQADLVVRCGFVVLWPWWPRAASSALGL